MRTLHLDSGLTMRGGQWQVLYLTQRLSDVTLLAKGALLEAARARPLRLTGWPSADLVHAHDAHTHTLAVLNGRRPLIVSRRVAFPPRSRWKYSRATHFIAVSEFVRSRLMEFGIPGERISVVYDGVPLRPSARGGGRIVAPATHDPRKGSALLREAAALGGFDVHFSTDLQADLEGAAALVYITHEEGLGSGALLAMAAGIPVVASRVGGLPEAVGDAGILVENEPAAIAAAIRQAAGDRALGERGRVRVAERFSVDTMVAGTLAVYDRVLACSKPSSR